MKLQPVEPTDKEWALWRTGRRTEARRAYRDRTGKCQAVIERIFGFGKEVEAPEGENQYRACAYSTNEDTAGNGK